MADSGAGYYLAGEQTTCKQRPQLLVLLDAECVGCVREINTCVQVWMIVQTIHPLLCRDSFANSRH